MIEGHRRRPQRGADAAVFALIAGGFRLPAWLNGFAALGTVVFLLGSVGGDIGVPDLRWPLMLWLAGFLSSGLACIFVCLAQASAGWANETHQSAWWYRLAMALSICGYAISVLCFCAACVWAAGMTMEEVTLSSYSGMPIARG